MRCFLTAMVCIVAACPPAVAVAQVQVEPILRGQVSLGDTLLSEGRVVLHEITDEDQRQVDSVAVGPDGSFSFRLPRMPDGSGDLFYFASIRHAGILYFGSAVTEPAQVDSLYEIQTYDTLMVPAEGGDVAVQQRNIFIEPEQGFWRVTDIFLLFNAEDRTMVAPEGGIVWSYPLLEGAANFTSGQGELSLDGTRFEDGVVSIRAALAPGERAFVFRYTLEDPYVAIPTPKAVGMLDVLVREPATNVGIEGLELVGRVALEEGSTYRRYHGTDVVGPTVRVVEASAPYRLPLRWITVVLALVLTGAGLFALRARGPAAARAGVPDRSALLVEVARLDESFQARASPSRAERAAYERQRAELIRRLRAST